MKPRVAVWAACAILAAVFIAAALPKIAHPDAFALAIYRHHLAPPGLINALAIYLPWLELVAAIALLAPRLRAGAAWVILLMLVLFTAAVAYNVHRGLDITCGCFSVSSEGPRIGWRKVAENLGLIAIAVFVLLRSTALDATRVMSPAASSAP
ncbi:MAG: DoxX family protein [Verrucomicrobia bacterium]|nr:DoxX family protein [Verrucomicrobiota bacterium]